MAAAPDDECPFCQLAVGRDAVLTKSDEVVARREHVTAFVSSHWWPANPGHVLVIPNEHLEGLDDLPDWLGGPLMVLTRDVALAMKSAFRCQGISTRQHNEAAGAQDVFHFHIHVFPRWTDDRLYQRHDERFLAPEADRLERAELLRAAIEQIGEMQ